MAFLERKSLSALIRLETSFSILPKNSNFRSISKKKNVCNSFLSFRHQLPEKVLLFLGNIKKYIISNMK